MEFPNDAGGDALRHVVQSGFDFTKESDVDFNIYFDHRPVSESEYNYIKGLYPGCKFYEPEGYSCFQMRGLVTYKFVTSIQKMVTDEVRRVGGTCESWGVLQS